jgi:hypothetical protein
MSCSAEDGCDYVDTLMGGRDLHRCSSSDVCTTGSSTRTNSVYFDKITVRLLSNRSVNCNCIYTT